jgi:TetR/AcrR family transcriptional repressor of nem operon
MTARPEQKQSTRRRIVAAASAAIRERGLEAPSVSQVMGEAGLTVGGFYAHFDSRDSMVAEALAQTLHEQLARWLAFLPPGSPAERRRLTARAYLSRSHRDTGAERCPIPAIASEIERADPRVRAVVLEHLDAWVASLSDANEVDGRSKALAAICTMVGALTLARALGSNAASDQLLAAAKAAIG